MFGQGYSWVIRDPALVGVTKRSGSAATLKKAKRAAIRVLKQIKADSEKPSRA